MVKTVVILGGSYAGLHIAHYLLKKNNPDVKVVLVSKV
jgi:apoptosis-inducing factor 2